MGERLIIPLVGHTLSLIPIYFIGIYSVLTLVSKQVDENSHDDFAQRHHYDNYRAVAV